MFLSSVRPPLPLAAEPIGPRRRPLRAGLNAGFTIVEIMIVLAIIGLLAGVLWNGLNGNMKAARAQVAKLFVQQTTRTPFFRYSTDVGGYPSTEEGLQALIKAPADKADRWQGPYLDATNGQVPADPWGRPYKYLSPGVHNKDGYDLWSVGPDGVDGTADDIGNW